MLSKDAFNEGNWRDHYIKDGSTAIPATNFGLRRFWRDGWSATPLGRFLRETVADDSEAPWTAGPIIAGVLRLPRRLRSRIPEEAGSVFVTATQPRSTFPIRAWRAARIDSPTTTR